MIFQLNDKGTLAEAYMTRAVLVRYKHEEQMKVRETAARGRFYQKHPHGGGLVLENADLFCEYNFLLP